MLAELFEAAGLPAGVFNVVTCGRDKVKAVAAAMINDPRVARISFTGSTAVGREVALASATQFKRVVLELGGKNPVVVLDDADVDYAVNVAFFSAFLHQGQIRMSADKIIVARSLRKFCRKAHRQGFNVRAARAIKPNGGCSSDHQRPATRPHRQAR